MREGEKRVESGELRVEMRVQRTEYRVQIYIVEHFGFHSL